MSNQKARSGIVRAFLKVAVAALLILAVVGCSDSASGTGAVSNPPIGAFRHTARCHVLER